MTERSGPLLRLLEANTKRIDQRPTRAPERELVILFTARTGSSHLAELLTSAGVGDVREWLHPAFLQGQAEYFGAYTFEQYFQRMRSVCPGGVFGHKMTIWFYEAFSREVRLEDYFSFTGPSVVLFRERLVEQAVSLYLANQRKLFHDTGGPEAKNLATVAYDAMEIMQGAETLCLEEERLKNFIERQGMSPRYVSYEEFTAADPARVIESVASLVGVKAKIDAAKSRHSKLRDRDNVAHAERFVTENSAYCASLHTRRRWLFDAARISPLLNTDRSSAA